MKITDNIHVLHPSRGCLVYVLKTPQNGIVVVDSGSCSGDGRIVVDYIQTRMGCSSSSVKTVFLTHWHADHAGGADQIRKMTGAKIVCSRIDAPLLEGNVKTYLGRPVPRSGMSPLLAPFIDIGYRVLNADTRPVTPDEVFDEGPAAFAAGWNILSLPGHTPGSSGLWNASERILFSGDTVLTMFGKATPSFTILIEDFASLKASWEKINSLGIIDWLLPGHFKPKRIANHIKVSRWLERKASGAAAKR